MKVGKILRSPSKEASLEELHVMPGCHLEGARGAFSSSEMNGRLTNDVGLQTGEQKFRTSGSVSLLANVVEEKWYDGAGGLTVGDLRHDLRH